MRGPDTARLYSLGACAKNVQPEVLQQPQCRRRSERLCLPGSGCRGAFQFGVMKRLTEAGSFDLVAGASSGLDRRGSHGRGPNRGRAGHVRLDVEHQDRLPRSICGRRARLFGMARIVREALTRFVPNERIVESETELLVSTTRASRMLKSAYESAKARVRAIGSPRSAPATGSGFRSTNRARCTPSRCVRWRWWCTRTAPAATCTT
jgi:hypothetical protein